jgi:para-aminobenzoate synthetase/4-amino-4-deoxychorismate lyase
MADGTTAGAAGVSVFLDNSLDPDGRSLLFRDPVRIVRCDDPAGLPVALAAIEAALAEGFHAAGYLSYELGYALEAKLLGLMPRGRALPLLWVGIFDRPRVLDADAAEAYLAQTANGTFEVTRPVLSIDRACYLDMVRRVRDYIAAGDVYQINLTFKMRFGFSGDAAAFYRALRRKQRVRHGALVHTPAATILSLSPELFLAVEDGTATARPMKGTAPRRALPADDAACRRWLHSDGKSRAENLMIVDLLRNDLGRVAEIGSVATRDLFEVETYPTVHQMVSSVTGRLRPGTGFAGLVRGLFPCGSITGAPKVRAMEVIRELEDEPRGVYTGAIGHVAPDGAASFNVAIRTAVLWPDGRGEMGIGSGIVFDSDPVAEYEECLLKGRFLSDPPECFQLIETLRWSREEGFALLDRHLARLRRSAASLGFRLRPGRAEEALDAHIGSLGPGTYRVRLLLSDDGIVSVESTRIESQGAGETLRFALSERAVRSTDPLLYHKTTRRAFYESELARLGALTGCHEVVFRNERGELTEGSRTNLFVVLDGRLYTPPLASGLLPGTLREALMAGGEPGISERVLHASDLERAERIYLGNSVRGLVEAALVSPAEAPAEP